MEAENKYIAINIANTYMLSKICSKEDFIEEYMEIYSQARNTNEQIANIKLTKDEIYYLSLNIANTYMAGKFGNEETFIDEYMEIYLQVISYNNLSFNERELTEEVIRNLSMNIANTYMMGKIGSKKDFIEQYMNFYNKAIMYNTIRLKKITFRNEKYSNISNYYYGILEENEIEENDYPKRNR